MRLNQRTIQPYRIWYQYLQEALNDKDFSNKIDKKFYKDWNLILVKKQTFNHWYKNHKHLFETQDIQMKLYDNDKQTPNTLLVEIPVNYTVVRIRKEIGTVLKNKIAKQPNRRFKIQSNRKHLQTAPFDYFLWSYQFRKSTDKTLHEIWDLVSKKIKDRQRKYGVEKRMIKIKTMKRRLLSGVGEKVDKTQSIVISRNILKAKNILNNVCKGIFPGNYAI
jgi:hypothetical protein